jgi:hypothetical protein
MAREIKDSDWNLFRRLHGIALASQTTQASNASAIMISDVFMDFFMPPKITADRGGGQGTEELPARTLRPSARTKSEEWSQG